MQKIKDSTWKLNYSRFSPTQEPLREALCALGNGYFATRAAFVEATECSVHYPGTYIAGVYNKLPTHIAGRTIYNDDFVNCPNWLPIKFSIDGEDWLTPDKNNIIEFSQTLNIKEGILNRIYSVKDRSGKVTLIQENRIVSIFNPHLACISYKITPRNYSGCIKIISSIDGSVENKNVARYNQLNSKHLEFVKSTAEGNLSTLLVKTNQSKIKIATSVRLDVFINDKRIYPDLAIVKKDEVVSQEFVVNLNKRSSCRIEKNVSIYTSNDFGIKNVFICSKETVKNSDSFKTLQRKQRSAWFKLWQEYDIRLEGDDFVQKVIRLHMFHLLQSASSNNILIDAGLPARGLHGEAYRGHIFWDELFAMPFFNLHQPQISKSFLLYRYRRLKQARMYASGSGYKGAMFPWQSSSSGNEQTQIVHLNPVSGKWGADNSRIQRHVSFAIAYNIYKYVDYSYDHEFLFNYGAEMFLEIAKFASSLLKYEKHDSKYHTYGLMGPDEFHEKLPSKRYAGFKDNAYTNILISWVLSSAKEVAGMLPLGVRKKLFKKIKISEKTISFWQNQSQNIDILFNKQGIISQFDGYFKLKELDWQYYRRKYKDIHRLDRILKSEGKSCDEYKVAKQADTLMMFYLFSWQEIKRIFDNLSFKIDEEIIRKNYIYYVKRTSHGSTLSKVVHCYIAHQLDKKKESSRLFKQVLESDILDTQGGTTSEGIHVGVMGGSIDILIRGFAGIDFENDKIIIKPKLINNIKSLEFKLRYRKTKVHFLIDKKQITVKLLTINPGKLKVEFAGKIYSMNKKLTFKLGKFKGDRK